MTSKPPPADLQSVPPIPDAAPSIVPSRADPLVCRTGGSVHRWFQGTVLLVDRIGDTHCLQGAAAPVWIALDRPGRVADVLDRVGGPQPAGDGNSPNPTLVAEAIDALLGAGLLTATGADIDGGELS